MNSNNQKTYRHRDPTKTDLHKIIRENYQQVFYDSEVKGTTFPYHLKREFHSYLNCGVLSRGFARFHCGHCQKDKLVAYSCKRKAVCPSCAGRRMADTAKHLVDHVIPDVPVRQWVLSLPYAHRFLLSSHPKLLASTIGIFNRAISSFYKQKAISLGIRNPQVGSLVVIQRFGVRHKNRRAITILARPMQDKPKKKIQYRTPWAELLKRVFQYEVNYCDHCGTKLTLVACITSQLVCAKILKHLKMETVDYEAKTPRAPPVMDGFESDDLEYFDQAQGLVAQEKDHRKTIVFT